MIRFVRSGLLLSTFVFALAGAGRLPAETPANTLTPAEERGGWKLLFDGKSADGWRNYRKEGLSDGWKVADGAICRTGRGAGDIVTSQQYRFFELSLEYKISKGGNSGLMFRVTEDSGAPWHSGPEVQIQDDVAGHDPQKAGWLYQLYQPVKPAWATRFEKQVGIITPDETDATRPAGEWNTLYLRLHPQQCEVAVNGVSYYYFKLGDEDWNARVAKSKFAKMAGFGKAERGHICLQDHGNEVCFRNIKIRELPEDGSAPNPVDGKIAVEVVDAFPKLKYADWQGITEDGRVQKLRPLVLTGAGDGSNRIFLATQGGVIHVFKNDPAATSTQKFLDISKLTQDWQSDDEEGLLGLAFHPQYKQNGYFYVYYSSASEPRMSVVSRFGVSGDDPNRADPASEQVVMKIKQPFANHNGGSIAFGPDGKLYIALGDGGGRNDPLGHGQKLETWMGTILRIDVDKQADGQNYAVPADNPFVGRAGARPEIYAYGFRNIWRMSFDRKLGTLWAADVGQDLWEEINVVVPGGNYGWSIREASYGFSNSDTRPADAPLKPAWEYDHRVGKSITGGFVYRGKQIPELVGKYVYADYVTGHIWALDYDTKKGEARGNYAVVTSGAPVFAFGEDDQGELYFLQTTIEGQGIYKFKMSDK